MCRCYSGLRCCLHGKKRTVADKITFNREALGVVERKQWRDAESLGQIGASAGRISSAGVAYPLPNSNGSGPHDLLCAVDDFNKTISMVILELSDAAANLGSGVAEASKNYDATEEYNRERAVKLGVEWNK